MIELSTGILNSLTLALADPAGAPVATSQGPAWAMAIPGLAILGALICTLSAIFGVKTKLPAYLTVGCLGGAFATTVALLMHFDPAGGAMEVNAWEWFAITWGDGPGQSFTAPFGFYIDTLTIYWMLFVTGLATLIALYASEYMSHDVGTGYNRFFFAFNLFVFSMACLVMGGNLVMLYLGWEGVGLCSYLLIGYFYKKDSAVQAAKKAFIVNRIGDLGLALGLYLMFVHFGTIEYAELFSNEKLLGYVDAAMAGDFAQIPLEGQIIALLLMVGAFGKSAQFPLYVWLPDAMEGPTPVSALIHAATMVTAGVYLIARMFPVFLASEWALPVVAWIGTITALLAATIGMAQFDIKRIMAYSTVSQLGYMFAGLGVLTPNGAAYHVLTHAFFKALLFLCCGAVMHGFAGQLDLRKLSGVWKMKGWLIVSIGMLVGCLNLAGLPFTAGFFSKDTIIAEAFVTPGYQVIGVILLITALMTAYYTFRVFFRVFMGPVYAEPGDDHHGAEAEAALEEEHAHAAADPAAGKQHHFHPHAPGWAINTVLAILTIASIAATGLYFVGGEKDVTTYRGEHVKTKHYAMTMVQKSSAAFVTPYDHHAFDHANHSGGAAQHADAHGVPGDDEIETGNPQVMINGVLVEAEGQSSHYVLVDGKLLAAPGAGTGPRGSISEPLSVLGTGLDPHKAMYYISGVIAMVGIGLAWFFHLAGRTTAAECRMDAVASKLGPLPRWAENKWYVDEFYNAMLRVPLIVIGHLSFWFDKLIVDGLVNAFGTAPRFIAGMIRPSQSGYLHGYAAGMLAGVAALLLVVLAILASAGGAS